MTPNTLRDSLEAHRKWLTVSARAAGAKPLDLTNARLTGSDFYNVLKYANLTFVEGVIDLGMVNYYRMALIRHSKRTMVKCGCRWFTVREARKHWKGRRHRKEIRAALEHGVKLAKLRGWSIGR